MKDGSTMAHLTFPPMRIDRQASSLSQRPQPSWFLSNAKSDGEHNWEISLFSKWQANKV